MSESELRSEIAEKLKERDELEQKIKDLQEAEKVQMGGRAAGSALVDKDGYPLADVDVHSVRTTRHTLICAQNDHKDLCKTLERLMYSLHAVLLAAQDKSAPAAAPREHPHLTAKQTPTALPFLRVGTVVSGSPASTGGLVEGDLICKFGKAADASTPLGPLVQEAVAESLAMDVKVIRNGEWVDLKIRPGPWSGQGMLGCQVFPM